MDQTYEQFEAVCNKCGYVVHDASDVTNQPEKAIADLTETPETLSPSWLNYCTVQNATEDRLARGIDVLDGIGDSLEIGVDVRFRGAELYGESIREKLTDGRDADVIVTAALYCAAKEHGVPLPSVVLIDTAGINSRTFYRVVRVLDDSLDLALPTPVPSDYLPYFSSTLGLSERQEHESQRLLNEISTKYATSGKNPVGFVAAIVYTILAGERTQSEISDAAGISQETLRVRIAECREVGILE
ncbi:transcription initiation factor IIB family protein [Halocatena salina]|uniref:Transcription initiation factor IIB family protein n=1 Tax=Halocatena salina TaxID=2934340 RepID=A0A8U0A1Y7_9EURY|nr:transcription initiation factor IIB family protein [Halocatena salina]UPM43160.1 transcription initiation factor IIB family protein [Halocatena salina]